ncbi:MAG: dihydropteroate synthase [Candidatus Cloacimonetes bacterium]|nr:dihydropteroate synthase [Candidatus Cloacimonadota bacterium]
MNSPLLNLPAFRTPRIMGILNVTDDSFSDGGRFADPDKALAQAARLVEEGADILDIGGESTRPGAKPIPADAELRRVIPVLARIRENWPELAVSVDTRKSEVAAAAIELGAGIINDISALRHDPRMAEVLAAHPRVRLILMHMLGQPETMQENPVYGDVLAEVNAFFTARIDHAVTHGIARENILLDPGIGFGKTAEHNFRLLAGLEAFRKHGLGLVLGASRKRFIAAVDPSDAQQRIGGTLAAAAAAAWQGVEIVRVHDVKAHRQFFSVLQAIIKEAG